MPVLRLASKANTRPFSLWPFLNRTSNGVVLARRSKAMTTWGGYNRTDSFLWEAFRVNSEKNLAYQQFQRTRKKMQMVWFPVSQIQENRNTTDIEDTYLARVVKIEWGCERAAFLPRRVWWRRSFTCGTRWTRRGCGRLLIVLIPASGGSHASSSSDTWNSNEDSKTCQWRCQPNSQ